MRRVVMILLPALLVLAVALTLLIHRSGRLEAREQTQEPRPRREEVSGSSRYSESPILRDRVEHGELPPVDQRLPDHPLVVDPVEKVGRYQSEPHPTDGEP